MLAMRTFLDTVSSVVCTLDVIEQCDTVVMVESMRSPSIVAGDAWEVLQKMDRAGLVKFIGMGVVGITYKGRSLAADIRDLTTKQVGA